MNGFPQHREKLYQLGLTVPLGFWIVGFGFFVSICGTLTAGLLVWRYLFEVSQPGWTSLIVLVLLCTGVILMSLGFIGLYIGKIFEQTRRRPLYVIDIVAEGRTAW